MLAQQDTDNRIVFVGGNLAPWQENILARLNLLSRYVVITQTTRFATVIGHTGLYGHLAFPTRHLRIVFDHLSATVPGDDKSRSQKVFLSRGTSTKRLLQNRAEFEQAVAARGFDILDPATATFEEIVRAMRHARVVVGEGGAGMANVGFCEIGTQVFELQPIFFYEGFVKATCAIFNLKWHVYVARADASSAAQDRYSVNLADLMTAIDSVIA